MRRDGRPGLSIDIRSVWVLHDGRFEKGGGHVLMGFALRPIAKYDAEMTKWKKQSHVVYQCSYHIVSTARISISDTARNFGEVRRRTYEGYLRVEGLRDRGTGGDGRPRASGGNVPPRVSISDLMGFLKGKIAIGIFKHYTNLRRKPYWGNHFWSRGYCVSTIGMDEEKIRRYVRYQEENERLEEKEREEAGLF